MNKFFLLTISLCCLLCACDNDTPEEDVMIDGGWHREGASVSILTNGEWQEVDEMLIQIKPNQFSDTILLKSRRGFMSDEIKITSSDPGLSLQLLDRMEDGLQPADSTSYYDNSFPPILHTEYSYNQRVVITAEPYYLNDREMNFEITWRYLCGYYTSSFTVLKYADY